MSDPVCRVCHTPKPPICFEHPKYVPKHLADVCSSCISAGKAPARSRYTHSAKGKAARRRAVNRRPVEEMVEGVAIWVHRKEGS